MDLTLAKTIVDGAVDAFGPQINFNLNGLGEPLSYPHLGDVILYIGQKAPRGRVELFTSLIGPENRVEDLAFALLTIPNNVLLATTCHIRDDKGEILEQTARHFRFQRLYDLVGAEKRIDLHVATNVSKWTTEEDISTFRRAFTGILPDEKIHVVERLDSWLEYIRYSAVSCSDVTSQSVCDYPFKVFHVGWDGTILLCCEDDVSGEFKIGKIEKKSDIKEFWFGSIMENIRDHHNALDVEGVNPCDRCGRTKGYLKR